jgi:hypothetical protein
MARRRPTVLLSGMIAADPWQGGATWAVLQYLLGFQRLGYDVVFVEPVPPEKLWPAGAPLAGTTNAAYFRHVVRRFGLSGRAALLRAGGREAVGLRYGRLRELTRRADVLVNVAGLLTDPDLTGSVPLRVYLDLDPAFTQLWHAAQGVDMRFAGHNRFVTVGLALGRPGCAVPTCGRHWVPTLPPVVLERWPRARAVRHAALTTVGHWRVTGRWSTAGRFSARRPTPCGGCSGCPGASGRPYGRPWPSTPGKSTTGRPWPLTAGSSWTRPTSPAHRPPTGGSSAGRGRN